MKSIRKQGLFADIKVLLVGLGRLGGGRTMAQFLLREGARLTITDLKTKKELQESVTKLPKKRIQFVFGKHRKKDFIQNDVIVCNPATSMYSPWVEYARKHGKRIENDLTVFLSVLEKRKTPYLALTGTRGKTTTTHWLAHCIGGSTVVGGNMPEKGLLGIVRKKADQFVLELSSFQLEFMKSGVPAPRIACITNLSVDHLNRHKTFAEYARVKANIFLNQTANDVLIMNADDMNTKLFLKQKPKSRVYYTSLHVLSSEKRGLYSVRDAVYFKEGTKTTKITTIQGYSDHEKRNMLMAMLGAHVYGISWKIICKRIQTLPQIPLRQECVIQKKKYTVINDSAGTSPEATIAALQKFTKHTRTILITGGTDKQLDFSYYAKTMKQTMSEHDVMFLEGSATTKLLFELHKQKFFKQEPRVFRDIESIVKYIAHTIVPNISTMTTILFSPASASFEKFKNEFDRGAKFSAYAKKYL